MSQTRMVDSEHYDAAFELSSWRSVENHAIADVSKKYAEVALSSRFRTPAT